MLVSVPRLLAPLLAGLGIVAALSAASPPLILDMVHFNPGEPRYQTQFEDPKLIKRMGYNGKVYFLFDSPTLGVNWQSVDPDIFPKGSPGRKWVDETAARIDAEQAACKAQGLAVYAMSDLILFPKKLVEKYGLQKTFGDPRNPQTEKFLRLLIGQIFDRFPSLDGLVVRIGETYLQDAPFHEGRIDHNNDADATIIPLVNILRDEICVKRNKELIFRTWHSFDTDLKSYLKVSASVALHPKLVFGVKHVEGDFHRSNPFSKIIGAGRHPQIIEVQCSREYEGKGAYPNYIAHGVINGFEEHRIKPTGTRFASIGDFARQSPLWAGLWTWTRGGGWGGPYLKNELWPDLNAWVLAQWTRDVSRTEDSVFMRYATGQLGLRGDDARKFRDLALTSADAVIRGRASLRGDIDVWWTRDDGMTRPPVPADPEKRKRVLAEKDEAVKQWEKIVALAGEIHFPDQKTKSYVVISSEYGLDLYRIYQAAFHLSALGVDGDRAELRRWLARYDEAWRDYRALPAKDPQCATLYQEAAAAHSDRRKGIEKFIREIRAAVGTDSASPSPAKLP